MVSCYEIKEWPTFERLVVCVPCVTKDGEESHWKKDGWEKKKALEGDVCIVCDKTVISDD